MMKLYGFDTINTLKVLMLLKETNAEFQYIPVNIRTGEQRHPEFLAINPAGKVPVLGNGDQHQTESNAILLSLSQKFDWGGVAEPIAQAQLNAWLFYQASTQGPYFGQIEYWSKIAKTPNPEALAQYRAIASRTIAYLNEQLTGKQYVCGETYTIADIALFPWMHVHHHLGLSLDAAENLAGWLERIRNRPATQNALTFFGPLSIF